MLKFYFGLFGIFIFFSSCSKKNFAERGSMLLTSKDSTGWRLDAVFNELENNTVFEGEIILDTISITSENSFGKNIYKYLGNGIVPFSGKNVPVIVNYSNNKNVFSGSVYIIEPLLLQIENQKNKSNILIETNRKSGKVLHWKPPVKAANKIEILMNFDVLNDNKKAIEKSLKVKDNGSCKLKRKHFRKFPENAVIEITLYRKSEEVLTSDQKQIFIFRQSSHQHINLKIKD